MLLQDLRFAVRQLWLAPGFSLAVVLTLALGIGMNTAVFSMLDAFLLRKLPYPEPERVAALVVHQEGVSPKSGKEISEEDDSFQGSEWSALKQSVSGILSASWGGSGGVNLTSEAGAVRYVLGSRVSADYFKVLGVPMQLGRSFSENEDRPNGPSVAVLSSDLWRSAFQSDSQIVGKSVRLKGEPYTVVGVLAANSVTPSKAAVYMPLRSADTGECGGNNCGILVRLKPGVAWPQVNTQLSAARFPRLMAFEKAVHGGRSWISARPLQLELAGEQHDQVLVMMVAVGFILLIACANLASLALVRISRRSQEIATRLALGASSWAVLRQLWTETLLLALFGGSVGVGLAFALIQALERWVPPELVPMGGFVINLRVLFFSFLVTILTSVLFGALPATKALRLDLRSSIVSGSRGVLGTSGRLRHWLIGAEVALTLVLLTAAGLMIRTLIHLETRPPGFDPHNVMTAKASLDDVRYQKSPAFQQLLTNSVEAMRESVGTNDVAVGLSLPYERGLNDGFKILDGKEAGLESGSSLAYVTEGYFSTLKIPLLTGRLFNQGDGPSTQPVAVVNESFAKEFLKGSPIGRHFKSENMTFAVVGVVGDVAKKPGMHRSAPISTEPVFYVPASQINQALVNVAHIWFQPSWIVRARSADRASTIRRMQEAFAKIAPDLPFSGFYSMEQILAEQVQQQRIEVALLGTLAGLALLLSAVGLYALVSNTVVQRRREIGIRLVLGSTIERAMADIGRSSVIAMLTGLLAGFGLSFAALRVLASQIYGVTIYDPVTLVTVPLLLLAIGGCAILLPTLRISRLQPADTLRSE